MFSFRLLSGIVAISARVAAAEDASLTADQCAGQFLLGEEQGCEEITSLAKCIATAGEDAFRAKAEAVLVEAQAKNPLCELAVTPSFRVVNREVSPCGVCRVQCVKCFMFMNWACFCLCN